MLLILLILLIVGIPSIGYGYNGGAYRSGGFGIGAILLVILIVLLLTGGLRW